MAKKLRFKYPPLVKKDSINEKDHCYTFPSWISQLSYGGMVEQSEYFLTYSKVIEYEFKEYHGDEIRKDHSRENPTSYRSNKMLYQGQSLRLFKVPKF